MILFVGDQPSSANLSPYTAFVGTKSHATLRNWLVAMGIDEAQTVLINRTNVNFKYVVEQFTLSGWPIIALGREASKALAGLDALYYGLPHPSGRNRLLNDKVLIAKKLAACKAYINGKE